MTLRLASLIDEILRRNAAVPRPVAVAATDPLDRLARIVRAERARETLARRVPRVQQPG